MKENSTSNLQNAYLVLARRYRPQTFLDVLGHDAVIKTLQHALSSQKTSHAYLFSGPRGTGKTTIARVFAKALNCSFSKDGINPCNTCASCLEITESRSLDVQEIDGASHRGIDHIRAITEGASYAPTSSRFKIYIIDEAHMLTKEAWNALLKTLEEPPQCVKFFFATTEPHKIPATILSRCQRFSLRRISHAQIVAKLRKIALDMNVSVEDSALLRLADYADGAFRDAESLFDQLITFSEGSVTESTLEEVLGIAPFEWLLELTSAIEIADVSSAYKISDRVFFEGKDIGHFIEDLCDHFKTLLLLKLDVPLPTACLEERKNLLKTISKTFSQEHLIEALSLLSETQKNLASAPSERFLLEWLLISIIRIKRKVPLALVVKKLFELQEKMQNSALLENQAEEISPQTGLETSKIPSHFSCAKTLDPVPVRNPTQETPKTTPQSSKELASSPEKKKPDNVKEKAPVEPEKKPSGKKKTPQQAEIPEKDTSLVSQRDVPPPARTPHEEACLHENLIRFAAVELGATLNTGKK